jgi:hypothetical protein
MADLSTRLYDFYNSLDEFKAESFPSWQTAEIFNALLAMAKEELADDPVLQAITPAEQKFLRPGVPTSGMDAGSMRASVYQALSAMDETGPAVG